MKRRVYYDHEGAYATIAARGGSGWDDLRPAASPDSYDGVSVSPSDTAPE